MSKIIQFVKKKEDIPHWAGECLCGACGHEWAGAAPVGENSHLECPKCKRFWGATKHAFVPNNPIWQCNCGEKLFWITADGSMCRGCGTVSTDWM